MTLNGLPGWQGKEFFDDYALNLIVKNKEVVAGPKMHLFTGAQRVDKKEGMIAKYEESAPFLWRRCTCNPPEKPKQS